MLEDEMEQTHELGHGRLLMLSYKVHAAAATGDLQRLERAVRHFEKALQEHLRLERAFIATLSPTRARTLGRGQAQLLAATRALVEEATQGCPWPPGHCARRAEELLALLALQARDEHGALPHVA